MDLQNDQTRNIIESEISKKIWTNGIIDWKTRILEKVKPN